MHDAEVSLARLKESSWGSTVSVVEAHNALGKSRVGGLPLATRPHKEEDCAGGLHLVLIVELPTCQTRGHHACELHIC